MVDESKDKHSEEKSEKKEEDEEEKKAEKSFTETVKSSFEAMTEVIQSIAETQKSVSQKLDEFNGRFDEYNSRIKALETPTDLPLTPSGSSGEDVGADVKVPATPYVSNSEQASLDADGQNHGKDQSGLSMQQKATSTETPRPSAPVDTVNKSLSQDFNLVLKDARETGDLGQVGKNILYTTKYYNPEEVAW